MSRIDFVTGAPEKYAALVDRLAEATEQLRAAVRTARPAAMREEPADGWSAHRVLAHMAFYARVNGTFIYRMATMSDPQRLPVDPDAGAEALMGLDDRTLVDIVVEELGKTVDLLSGTPDAGWGRPGTIAGKRRSLRQQVQSHADHMHEHIAQIARLVG